MNDLDYSQVIARAELQGAARGKDAASWYFDGNTPRETYARVLKGIEDGDPEVLDSLPFLDLSGQWADGLTDADVLAECDIDADELYSQENGPETADEIIETFRNGFDAAVEYEIERMARYQLVNDAPSPTRPDIRESEPMNDPISTFSDEELARMIDRAYWRAAKLFREATLTNSMSVQHEAEAEQEYWRHLRTEADRRYPDRPVTRTQGLLFG